MANGMDGLLPGVAEWGRRSHSELRPDTVWSGREECGNPECRRGWLGFLKDRRRPVFEGHWGCTARCLETIARTAVRRESGEGSTESEEGEHRHRMPLGLILMAQGWITHPQLQHALAKQRRAGRGLIGHWLTEECGLDHGSITRGLGVQWGCPVLPMQGFDPARMALAVPRLLVEQVGMVPLRVAGKRTLQLAFASRPDASAAFAMERMSGLKVESGLVDEPQWKAAHGRLCESEFVDAAFEQVATVELLPGKIAETLNKMQPRGSRLVRVHELFWLRMWLELDETGPRKGGVPWTREATADRLYAVGTEQ